jgi:hypothetical protein
VAQFDGGKKKKTSTTKDTRYQEVSGSIRKDFIGGFLS